MNSMSAVTRVWYAGWLGVRQIELSLPLGPESAPQTRGPGRSSGRARRHGQGVGRAEVGS